MNTPPKDKYSTPTRTAHTSSTRLSTANRYVGAIDMKQRILDLMDELFVHQKQEKEYKNKIWELERKVEKFNDQLDQIYIGVGCSCWEECMREVKGWELQKHKIQQQYFSLQQQ